MDPSRRGFLKGFPLIFYAGGRSAAQPEHRGPDLRFPAQPRERLAVTSWPFRAYVESPANRNRNPNLAGWDIKAFPALVAEKFDVRNINPLGDHFSSTDPDYLEDFRRRVAAAKSRVVDLGVGGQAVYSPDAAQRKAAVEYGRKWIDIAAAIGSPSIRQHVKGIRDTKPDVELAAGTLAEMAEYGSKRNIVVNLENDNAVAEDPFFLVAVIQRVKSPYLRALPDLGNSLATHDAEFNARAVAAMFEYAYNMSHVKGSVRCGTEKVCTVDLQKMFGIARASSYKGYFSMEFDTRGELDPFQGTRRLIEETLTYLT